MEPAFAEAGQASRLSHVFTAEPGFPFPSQTYKTSAMQRRLSEIAGAVGARVVGDGQVDISAIASIASASASDLVFVEDEKHLASALESKAAAVIAGTFAENESSSKPLLIAANPRLAFARAARLLHGHDGPATGIHP